MSPDLVRESRAPEAAGLAAYRDLCVGDAGLIALLRHELIAVWGSLVPGAAGLLLRKWLWPRLFADGSAAVPFGREITLRHPGKIWIGPGARIDDGCCLDARGCRAGEFRVGPDALISRGSILCAKGGGLRVGARANFGAGCVLYSTAGLTIGEDVLLAAGCYVGGGRYDARGRVDIPLNRQLLPGKGTVIEDDCWLGAGVCVIDGVRVGRGSVIGAGAIVIDDVPAYSIAAGVPARVVATRTPALAAGNLP